MNDKILIDTSILVRAYDHADEEKQQTALTLLDDLVSSNKGLITSAIILGFYEAATGSINNPLTREEAEGRVTNFCQIWPVLQINEMVIIEALRGIRCHSFSMRDAEVWAAARLNQAGLVFSEDFPHDLVLEGVRFFNPFSSP